MRERNRNEVNSCFAVELYKDNFDKKKYVFDLDFYVELSCYYDKQESVHGRLLYIEKFQNIRNCSKLHLIRFNVINIFVKV